MFFCTSAQEIIVIGISNLYLIALSTTHNVYHWNEWNLRNYPTIEIKNIYIEIDVERDWKKLSRSKEERERRGDAWIGGRASESCSRGLKSCEKIQSFVLLFFSLLPPPFFPTALTFFSSSSFLVVSPRSSNGTILNRELYEKIF